jgi:L-iditol 2-dehydrogenase/galactitol-1-phosphate 5-dehydrogenase
MLTAVKALVLEANARLAWRDVPLPARPGPAWALVRIAAAGVCGSDLHRAFERGAYRTPLIMGHEMAGVVEEPAEGQRLRRGALVTVFPLLPCYRCAPCQTGDYAQCTDYDYFGSRRDGGFAEHLWTPEANLLEVPQGLAPEHAAMTEPCAVALHGVRRMAVRPGATGAVFGGGPIGSMVAQWLRVAGCRRILVVDVEPAKLDLAGSMGFEPVDGRRGDAAQQVVELTGGGAECVVEAAGLGLTYAQALGSAARGGQVVLLGNIAGELRLGADQVSSILRRELRVYGTWNSRVAPRGADDWSTALALMGRDIQVAPLITHTPPLAEGASVLERMHRRSEPFGKVVFRVG